MNSGDRVHELRRGLKKERAHLKLLRGGLGRDGRRSENAALRDAGRALSAARDAAVLPHALALLERHLSARKREALAPAAARLRAKRTVDDPAAIQRAERALAHARALTRAVDDLPHGERENALRRLYKRTRDARDAAKKTGRAADFHEWRKRAKDLRYALERLALAKKTAKKLHALSDLLGEAHDLEALPPALERGEAAVIREAVDRRAGQLRRRALALAKALFARKPKDFAKRVL